MLRMDPGSARVVANPKMRGRFDSMTVLGLLIAIGGVLGGHFHGSGSVSSPLNLTAFLVVIVGSFGAVLVSTPRYDVLRGLRSFTRIVVPPAEPFAGVRDSILELASLARREGLIALEERLEHQDLDPFLARCLGLAVDGSSSEALRDTVETDMELTLSDLRVASRFWENWGSLCPTIGVLGAVLGLIDVMGKLESPGELGRGIAAAFVATVYGVGYSNLVCLPVAFKLRRQAQREQVRMSMILEGVLGIQSGIAPGVLRTRLSVYVQEPVAA